MLKRKLRPIVPGDLCRLQTMDECELSPDGQLVAVVIHSVDKAQSKKHSHIWLVPVSGGRPVQYTFGGHRDMCPRFNEAVKETGLCEQFLSCLLLLITLRF